MAPWRDAPPEWGTEATPARQAALRANVGHTAQNDHQPVGQDSPAGLFYCQKTPRAQPDFIFFSLAYNRIHIWISSHFAGCGAESARAQPDFICFALAHNRIQNYLLADVMVSRAQPELRFISYFVSLMKRTENRPILHALLWSLHKEIRPSYGVAM